MSIVETLLLYVDKAQVFLPYRLIYSVSSSFMVLHCGITKVPMRSLYSISFWRVRASVIVL